MPRLILIVFAIVLFIANPVRAEWATFADATLRILYQNQEINIKSDGTYDITFEEEIEILKDEGRGELVEHTALKYNEDCGKIEVLEAATIYKGIKYSVAKDSIEDKPLASDPKDMGFDQIRQITMAFRKLEVGAIVHFKYHKTVNQVELEKIYSDIFFFNGANYPRINKNIKIHSQLPLHLLVNDPENILAITKDKNDNFYELEISLTKPTYKYIINEPSDYIIVNYKLLTWVSISSLDSWEDLAKAVGKNYAKVFSQPLPILFENIAKAAVEKEMGSEQINVVTSMLADKIQYLGNWRSINGRFVPRDLEEISNTQYGDCKDFAAATAAILNSLGYKIQMAIVRRGERDFFPDTLPTGAAFNHAILTATDNSGNLYWIDPTNFVSMADGIFPDIAGKMALVVDQNQPGYKKIPTINPDHAEETVQKQIEVLDKTRILRCSTILLKNEAAFASHFIEIYHYYAPETFKNILYQQVGGVNLKEEEKKKLEFSGFDSRIVKDQYLSYCVEQDNQILETNAGSAIKLTCPKELDIFFGISPKNICSFLVDKSGVPVTSKTHFLIKNIEAKNIDFLNKEIDTPWLYVKREAKLVNNNDLQIDTTIVNRKIIIDSQDLKTPEFIKLQKDLERNFKEAFLIFNLPQLTMNSEQHGSSTIASQKEL